MPSFKRRSRPAARSNPTTTASHLPWFAAIVFAVSGIAASVYQVAWQRVITLSGGSTTAAVSLSVAAFIGGLGIGGALGGRLSHRRSRAAAWSWFCACEALVACYAWFSPWLLTRCVPLACTMVDHGIVARVVQFLCILIPAVPMGATLPLLVQGEMVGGVRAERTIGALYAANTAGAAGGAAWTVWHLFPTSGIEGAIYIGAALSTTVVAAGVWRRLQLANSPAKVEMSPASRIEEIRPVVRLPLRVWLALSGFAGFIAIGLELVWFRLLDSAVKSTSLTYGTLLSVYLGGLALGASIAALHRPSRRDPLEVFLLLQIAAVASALLAVLALVRCPTFVPGYSDLVDYWRSYEGLSISPTGDNGRLAALYVGLALFLVGAPTTLFGAAFVYLQRAVQHGVETGGRLVGYTLAANIAGNVLGSLLTCFLLFPMVGTAGATIVFGICGLLFPTVLLRIFGVSRRAWSATAILALLVALMPSNDALWRRLHGEPAGTWLFDEDADAVVAVCEPQPDSWESFDLRLSVNGKGISWFPYGSTHTHLGVLPTLVHPQPRRAAIIGLGSGDTAWGASLNRDLTTIEVFEICGGMQRVVDQVASRPEFPKALALSNDARVVFRHDDGRHALMRGAETYDVIEIDALRPQSPGAGNLYSIEFYRLCASRLGERGVMCQWTPTLRTIRGFCTVFPHVLFIEQGPILIGSRTPLNIDPAAIERRIGELPVSADMHAEIRRLLQSARPLRLVDLPPGAVNEDLFPRDEFAAPEP